MRVGRGGDGVVLRSGEGMEDGDEERRQPRKTANQDIQRGKKPDQQAMNIYKSNSNEEKTSPTSRLRTATK
jgi:hypothetical protein